MPHKQYDCDRLGTKLMCAQMYTQLDVIDLIVHEMCTHTDELPTTFDHMFDAMVSHATADTNFILRHLAYQRIDAMMQIHDELQALDKPARLDILDPRSYTANQAGRIGQKILCMYIEETS